MSKSDRESRMGVRPPMREGDARDGDARDGDMCVGKGAIQLEPKDELVVGMFAGEAPDLWGMVVRSVR